MEMKPAIINKVLKVLQTTGVLPARRLASLRYRYKFGHWPDISNPVDLNEKILALMFRTDTSEWTRLADKYEVRAYVESKGLSHLLPRLYGIYDRAEDIDFDRLPRKCAVKCTNGCGYVLIYDGDQRPDPAEAREKVKKWMDSSYGYITAEPHYTHIPNRIIVEELIEKDDAADRSLIDYKIWCFKGEPVFALCCSDRNIEKHQSNLGYYTLPDWRRCPEKMHHSYSNASEISKPHHLAEMMEYARRLSEPFPLVRVDFYESNGTVLFGELTFSSNGGRMRYFTDEVLLELGRKVDLTQVAFND